VDGLDGTYRAVWCDWADWSHRLDRMDGADWKNGSLGCDWLYRCYRSNGSNRLYWPVHQHIHLYSGKYHKHEPSFGAILHG
jgi:hypothetical protein